MRLPLMFTMRFLAVLALVAVGGSYRSAAVPPAGTPDEIPGPVRVRVGGYPFEPFVEGEQGVTPAFLTLLNDGQDEVRFEFVTIPAQRRYELLRRGTIDAIFFEMPLWGWGQLTDEIATTRPILRGREMFVVRSDAQAVVQSGENAFDLSPERKVALTLGYHYAFADFQADQAYIRSKVDAMFSERISQTLQYLLSGAVEIAVVSDVFLLREYQRKPALKDQIQVADKPDHEFALPLLVRKRGPITAAQLDARLGTAINDGSLMAFFARFGLENLMITQAEP